jgi:FtsP/CotA-like multicopper oxidase with cupredoxin domain
MPALINRVVAPEQLNFRELEDMKVNDMKKFQRGSFKLNPVASALLVALASQFPANVAQANAGFSSITNIAGTVIDVPTYYASSPQGVRAAYDPAIHGLSPTLTVDTGAPLRKFVDPLGGVYNGLENLPGMTDLQSGIPVALTEKWLNPLTGVQTKDDYYEIAVVEFTEQLHSDLPKATRLRGYVQIETPGIVAGKLKDITGLIGSEHIPGVYPDGTPILDATGKQVFFVHKPHYLGPAILAARGNPVRIKYTNYLPYTDSTGKSVGSWNGQGGEAFVPVDETIAGGGPVTMPNPANPSLTTPVLDLNGKPIKFSQNRVSIHWHGGDSPWTNDGTPHQWFAPRGDISYSVMDATHPNGMGVGDSFQNVPDMADPGPGSQTLYFPMNLSGRLMMYHDHVSGLTKVNVYEGEAAGLIVYDPTELTLAAKALNTTLTTTLTPTTGPLAGAAIPTGLLDSVGIPLVIQDKTFVPKNIGPTAVASDGKTPASQDAKYDLTHWGQPGDFFFPHVYETNQDPNSVDGTNPNGRWDWGPWFWPVFPAQYSLPTGVYGDVTATPEAFMDTPLVNGQVYPTMTVDPKTYRFRILSVANDRTFSLGLYQAVDAAGKVCDATNPAPTPNATQAYTINGVAQGAPALCTEVRMVPAKQTAGFPATWPTDGRAGGVPDPATAGPDIVQIGNEGGLLPAVAVWKSQPVTFEQNVRSITIFNVLDHDLTLMGGERADAFIDFSKYAGQTLILYNDAPAPFPGYDPRIDYYTGVGDQVMAGGAYDTLPGYGPNTRTVMQIKVNATNTSGQGGPLNVAALTTALPVAYAATQPKPIIPETVYDPAFGTASVDTYAKIGVGANSAPYLLPTGVAFAVTGFKVTAGGSKYSAGTTATFSAPQTAGVTATAKPVIDLATGAITGFNNFLPGSGYTNTSPLTVTFTDPALTGSGASASVTTTGYAVINKAIQELFDPVFGRMNATLAVELPFSTATVATTIPLAYIDTPIEYLDGIKEGETQIWKVTHNGVDSHPVHFHLVNVQVINRVGWDGVVKPPAANEVGWKETLRMNPLEDVYVAVRASRPVTPFGVPASQRVLDPSQAVGSSMYFTNIDPLTGAAPTFQTQLVNGVSTNVATVNYSNQLTDFDNEYVWHCHILGHEEQDFMRPFIFHPSIIVPDAPAAVTVAGSTVSWTDTTPVGGQDAQGIPTAGTNLAYPEPTSSPKNEIGFKVYNGALLVATLPANVTSWTDASVSAANAYSVVAWNAAGTSLPGTSATTTTAATTVTPPTPPATTPGTIVVSGTLDATGGVVTIASTSGLVVGASVSGGGFPQGTTITAINTVALTFTTSFVSTVACATAPTTLCAPVTLTVSMAAAAALPTPSASSAPSGLTQGLNAAGAEVLSWTAVPGATAYTVTITETQAPVAPALVGVTLAPVVTTIGIVAPATTPATTYTTGKLNTGSTYTFSVTATTLSGTTAAATVVGGLTNSPTLPPVAFTGIADAVGSGSITLQWANNALNKNNVAGLLLNWGSGSKTFAPTSTGATVIGLTAGTSYSFTLQATSNVAAFNSATVTATNNSLATPAVAPIVAP